MWRKTAITSHLGIKFPIIQGPFGGNFSSAELVTAVSDKGGLGSFGLNAYDHDDILRIGTTIKSMTTNPFALNLWVPTKNNDKTDFSTQDFEILKRAFKPFFEALEVPMPSFPTSKKLDFEDQFEAVLKVGPPVMSFIFGVPNKDILSALQKRKIKTIATATTVDEALLIQEAGVDIIIASGKEAGGHRASFLLPPEQSLHHTKSLVSQLTAVIKKPIVAAGGISTGRDIANMLKMGVAGVQLGTVFLATEESNAPQIHKEALLADKKFTTTLTKVFTGRTARAISNKLTQVFDLGDVKALAPFPLQSSFLSTLRKKALEKSELDYLACWAGETSSVLKHKTVESLMKALIVEIEASYS